jgi:hypothetical protein
MSTVRRIHRPAVACALACAGLAAATSTAAAHAPNPDLQRPAALRPAVPHQVLRSHTAREAGRIAPNRVGPSHASLLAQERYHTSYGNPGGLAMSQSPAPSDGTPWLPVTLAVLAELGLLAAIATRLRRLRLRRRRAVVLPRRASAPVVTGR